MELPVITGTLNLYISEINRFSLLTPEEEFKLAVRLKKYNDVAAAEKLIVSNLRFVVKIAHEYRNYGFKLADLIQDAMTNYLHEDVARGDALRACDKFCSHGSALERHEIDDLLQEDMLAS